MKWTISFTKKAEKQAKNLPKNVFLSLNLLVEEMKLIGPTPSKGWLNYSRLNTKKNVDQRHCHLKKGHPTYVCCWEVKDKKIRIIEVYYVGTHEKAPY